jgi:hypothetical protein
MHKIAKNMQITIVGTFYSKKLAKDRPSKYSNHCCKWQVYQYHNPAAMK